MGGVGGSVRGFSAGALTTPGTTECDTGTSCAGSAAAGAEDFATEAEAVTTSFSFFGPPILVGTRSSSSNGPRTTGICCCKVSLLLLANKDEDSESNITECLVLSPARLIAEEFDACVDVVAAVVAAGVGTGVVVDRVSITIAGSGSGMA